MRIQRGSVATGPRGAGSAWWKTLAAAALFALLLAAGPAGAVGFQWGTAPDPDGKPLDLAIWYPSDAAAQVEQIGPFRAAVALNGAISGRQLPLVVVSHGTGGSAVNFYDTAIALADAGFVVAAVTHTGDNYKDQSDSFTSRNFANRARQISRVIDFMLGSWPGHAAIDPARVGMFGHSAGGMTGLIVIGGRADWSRVVAFCAAHQDDWGCRNARQRGAADAEPAAVISHLDPRVKAAVLAAPALAAAFGQADVAVPVQLWVASQDAIVSDAASVRALLPASADYHLVERAGHFAFLAPCSESLALSAPAICQDPDGFDRPAFLRDFQRSIIAFFRANLSQPPNPRTLK